MNKVKFLTVAVVALALLNIGLLFFFTRGHMPPPRREQPRAIIIKRLHFDEAQVANYEQLIQQHRAAIKPREEAMRQLRAQLYSLLNAPSAPLQDSLQQRIGQLQIEIEATHFKHFLDIKNLCKPDQMADFEALSKELEAFFGPPKPPLRGE
jgi:periplasmic protein CpxP/Spy